MIDLSSLARRFGYRADARGFNVGLARITQPEGEGLMFASTSDSATADALYHSDVGEIIYRQQTQGRISLRFNPKGLGRIVAAVEELHRS